MHIQYISLGYDCSPAATLHNLDLRSEALPFDWIVSSLELIMDCIDNNFETFHQNLSLDDSHTRLVDSYGFQFLHDYPLDETRQIVSSWHQYHQEVLEKYKRRISRFYKYLENDQPIIFLCRNYSVESIVKFSEYINKKFKKNNIYFIVSSHENYESQLILTCNTEINGIWNESSIWRETIHKMITMNHLPFN